MAFNCLIGNLLAANPSNPKDHLERSVLLIAIHNQDMALGLQINKPLINVNMREIGDQVGLYIDSDELIFQGGNLHGNKIHVIHSSDWKGLTTIDLTEDLCLTNDLSILTALANNEGPELFKACAGFIAWEAGQLENQLYSKTTNKYKWELVKADKELVFDSGIGRDNWDKVIKAAADRQINSWFNLFQD